MGVGAAGEGRGREERIPNRLSTEHGAHWIPAPEVIT